MPGRRERFHKGFSRASVVGFRHPALVFRRAAGPLPSLSPQAVRGAAKYGGRERGRAPLWRRRPSGGRAPLVLSEWRGEVMGERVGPGTPPRGQGGSVSAGSGRAVSPWGARGGGCPPRVGVRNTRVPAFCKPLRWFGLRCSRSGVGRGFMLFVGLGSIGGI